VQHSARYSLEYGDVELMLGRLESARHRLEYAHGLALEHLTRSEQLECIGTLALAAYAQGDLAAADRMIAEVAALDVPAENRAAFVKEECGGGGNMIAFGCGDQQSCSSSDGTTAQYGGQFGGRHHGRELSFDHNGYCYGAYNNGVVEQDQQKLFQQQQAQLDYGYEEIKQMLMTAGTGADGGGLIHDPAAAELIASHAAAGKLTMM
jgi:hypothetical protein